MKARWFVFSVLACVFLIMLIWIAQVYLANRIAQRDFSAKPCWFVQEDLAYNRLPGLVPGPKGIYIPNPLRQLNRRFLGFGLYETSVYAPHFAVAALDADGRPALWGWSYRMWDFWSISEKAQSRRFGALNDFASEDEIRAACPNLKPPLQTGRIQPTRDK